MSDVENFLWNKSPYTSTRIENLIKLTINGIEIDIICDPDFDLNEDAKKRIFTCNALYADAKGVVFDPLYRAMNDLSENNFYGYRRIVPIGNPAELIKNDLTLILRCARLILCQGLTADDSIKNAILYAHNWLPDCGGRMRHEVGKTFLKGFASDAFCELRKLGCLQYIFPGINQFVNAPNFSSWVISKLTEIDNFILSSKDATVPIARIYAVVLSGMARCENESSPSGAIEKHCKKMQDYEGEEKAPAFWNHVSAITKSMLNPAQAAVPIQKSHSVFFKYVNSGQQGITTNLNQATNKYQGMVYSPI